VRVIVVDTYYPAFLEAHYAARPGLAREPYETQLASLMDRSFGTSDAYSRNLRAAGHEATEIVANAAALQNRWSAENGSSRSGRLLASLGRGRLATRPQRGWLRRIAVAQVEAYNPHVVYVQDTSFFARPDLDGFRRAGRFVVGQLASPAPPLELLRGYDLIVTSFPHFVERLAAAGIDSAYLPLAFDTAVLDRLQVVGIDPHPAAERPHEVTFVGGVDPRVHAAGTALLERAATESPIDVWGYGAAALPSASPLRQRHHGEAWGLDMYEVLARSRIVLNRHIDVAEDFANNMRLYEATGAGALLLTDAKRNLSDIFQPGAELVAYRDADDLTAQLRRLRADHDERIAIATAGHARTLRDHTYGRRMQQLAEILKGRLRG
jgi:spore maturation protein CgeB